MTSQPIASTVRPPGLMATPGYARLWFAGGVGNAMRWLELLVAGIFTYDLTHSAFLVAVVTVTRSLPMLFLGPIAGVIAEAVNRKRLLLAQLLGMAAVSAVLAALAWSGEIRVWHIALGGAITGIAWASELAVRRRMLGEVVPADQVVAAVALDSLTNSVARVLGPLCGGAAFEALGLGGAYLVSAGLYLAASVAVIGLDFHQGPRRPLFAARVIPVSWRGHRDGAVAVVRARLCAVADRRPRHRRVFQYADEPHPRGGAARHPLAGDGDRHDVHRHRADRRLDDRRAVGRTRSAGGGPGHGRDWRRRAQPHRTTGARAALRVTCVADRQFPAEALDEPRASF